MSFTLFFAQFPLTQVHIRCNSNKCHGVGNVQKDNMTEKLVDRPKMEKNKRGKELCRGEVSDRKD